MKLFSKPYEYHLLSVFALYLLGLISYSNTLEAPFIFDDFPNIRENPFVRLSAIDLEGLYRAGFESVSETRPIANISFALNYYFGGYDVTGYHLINILVHALNGVLVYFLALILLAASGALQPVLGRKPASLRWVALLVAAVFVAHPVQTQSVTYIVQRMTSLAVLFYLSALLLYLLGRLRPPGLKRGCLWSGGVVAWLLALGCKEIAASLPVAVLLTEWCFFRGAGRAWTRRDAGLVLLVLTLVAVLGFLYLGLQPREGLLELYQGRGFSPAERVLTELRVVVFYLSLLVFPDPSRLSLQHAFSVSHSLLEPMSTLVCAVFLLALAGLAIGLARRHAVLSFCILWFFITLAIESSVIGLELVYEHRLYLPMFGFSLALGYLIAIVLGRFRAVAFALGIGMVILLGSASFVRNMAWQDRVVMWNDVVAKNPSSHRARNNLGRALVGRRRNVEAAAAFEEALRLEPDYAEPYNNLGVLRAAARDFAEAVPQFEKALELKPDYAQAHQNLGVAMRRQGRLSDAIRHFRAALAIDPYYAKAHANLGRALMQLGDRGRGCQHLAAALRWDPGKPKLEAELRGCRAPRPTASADPNPGP